MIRNVILDISNVLVDYKLKEYLSDKGFSDDVIRRIIHASVLSPYWEPSERDELTEEEALTAFTSLDPEIGPQLRLAFSSIAGMLIPRPYAIPWVQSLKAAGLGVYYLSNYSRKAVRECPGSLGFAPYADGGLLSYQVGLSKPDPAFYRRLLDVYGLKAEECLFIDDTPANVEAAEALGFAGLVFTTREAADERIRELTSRGV